MNSKVKITKAWLNSRF